MVYGSLGVVLKRVFSLCMALHIVGRTSKVMGDKLCCLRASNCCDNTIDLLGKFTVPWRFSPKIFGFILNEFQHLFTSCI